MSSLSWTHFPKKGKSVMENDMQQKEGTPTPQTTQKKKKKKNTKKTPKESFLSARKAYVY